MTAPYKDLDVQIEQYWGGKKAELLSEVLMAASLMEGWINLYNFC